MQDGDETLSSLSSLARIRASESEAMQGNLEFKCPPFRHCAFAFLRFLCLRKIKTFCRDSTCFERFCFLLRSERASFIMVCRTPKCFTLRSHINAFKKFKISFCYRACLFFRLTSRSSSQRTVEFAART